MVWTMSKVWKFFFFDGFPKSVHAWFRNGTVFSGEEKAVILEMVNLIQEDEVNERIHNLASKYDDIVVTMGCKMKDIFIVDQI